MAQRLKQTMKKINLKIMVLELSPKGIKNLKLSSNVNEFVIQCKPLKKNQIQTKFQK